MYGITTKNDSLIAKTGADLPNMLKPNTNGAATPNVVQAESVKIPKTNSVGNQETRVALNNMGFNDADIGWDGSRVTYKGQGIVQPASVEEGVSYAPESVNYAGAVDWLKNNGYRGMRQGLNDRGITDVGWDNGYVTVDGQRLTKPQYNVDGKTYATEDEINALAQQAYANRGDNLVAPRDYAASKNHSGIVDWDGANVLIGGQAVKPVYVKDGTAYIKRSDADRLIGDYENNSGVTSNQSIVDENEAKYGAPRDAAFAEVQNREKFSWDPETDEAWQRHVDLQTRLANQAYEYAINNDPSAKYGMSGAVLSEAAAARNDYLSKLSADELEYRQNAYDEYEGETDRLRNNFYDIDAAANGELDRRYTANRDDKTDSRNALLDEREEKWNWMDYDFKEREDRRAAERAALENMILGWSNKNDALDYVIKEASEFGEFRPEHEAILPLLRYYRNDDGTYSIKPWQMEEEYTRAMAYANALGQYKASVDAYK